MASLLTAAFLRFLCIVGMEFSPLSLWNEICVQTDIWLEKHFVYKDIVFQAFRVRKMFGSTSNYSCSWKELDFKMRRYSNLRHSILDFDSPVFKQGRMHQCINLLEGLKPCLITNLVCVGGIFYVSTHSVLFFSKSSSNILVSISSSLP